MNPYRHPPPPPPPPAPAPKPGRSFGRYRSHFSLPFLLVVAFLLPGCFGCTNTALQIQAHAANGIGVAANAALPTLIDRYRSELTTAVFAVKERGGTADDARAAIAAIKDRWETVWRAWEALAVAQGAWATALEQGGDVGAALIALKATYCGLTAVWPEDLPVVPLAPLRCPKVTGADGV